MQLVRFHLPGSGARLGGLSEGRVYDLSASGLPRCATLEALLQASVRTPIQELLRPLRLSDLPTYAYADLERPPDAGTAYLLPPIDRQEVWAAGVTYEWSREARVREALAKDI